MGRHKTAALTAVWRHMSGVDEYALREITILEGIVGYMLGYLDRNSLETIKQRTILIDSLIRKIKPKCIVEIGAGFSSRAKRFGNIKFYELDLPYFKTRKNSIIIFDIEKDNLKLELDKALFIVEGVTMYLNEDNVIKLLKQIKKHEGSIIIDFFNREYSTIKKSWGENIFKIIFKAFIGRGHLFDYRIKNVKDGTELLKKLGYRDIRHYNYNIPKTLDVLFYAKF